MSTAVIDQVADAVVSEINSQITGLTLPAGVVSLNAQRADAEITDLTSLQDPLLLVIADKSATASPLLTRGRLRGYLYTIWVLLYGRVTWSPAAGDILANNALVDPWKLYTEQIADWFAKSNPLTALVNGNAPQVLGDVVIDPFPSLEALAEYGLYLAAINLPVFLQRQL